MTQVTVPSAGDPIITSWGQDVANHANHLIPVYATADATTTSTSFGTITGMSFAVVNGKEYSFGSLALYYTVGGTSTGLKVGYTAPSGTCRLYTRIYGNGSDIAATNEVLGANDTATGTTTTDSTAGRLIEMFGVYRCTADGTFSLRFARAGTSTTVTIYKGSGGVVVEN